MIKRQFHKNFSVIFQTNEKVFPCLDWDNIVLEYDEYYKQKVLKIKFDNHWGDPNDVTGLARKACRETVKGRLIVGNSDNLSISPKVETYEAGWEALVCFGYPNVFEEFYIKFKLDNYTEKEIQELEQFGAMV